MQWATQATVTVVGILSTYDNKIFHEAKKTEKGCIIKGRGCRRYYRFARRGIRGNVVYIVYRDPHRKMRFVWVKEVFHPVFYARLYIAALNMMEPVSSRIFGKGKAADDVFGVIIQLE
jgi:hypothetical protein